MQEPPLPTFDLAISGTRAGLTPAQKRALESALRPAKRLRHGDCVGVDAEAHQIAKAFGVEVHVHPPVDGKQRAGCEGDVVHAAQAYLKRNRAMVDAADAVVAFPKSDREERRGSGTWATIRYARKRNVPLTVVFPDGRQERTF